MNNKNLKPIFLLIAILFSVAIFSAFDQVKKDDIQPTKDLIPEIVQKELDRKIYNYKKIILDKCYKKAIDAAEIYIDSLVSEEIKFQAGDTLKFPAKPVRPELREPILLNDSTAIAPIIKEN